MLKMSTLIHKWLGLMVGIQVLGWVLGGVVMSAIPMTRVKSEHHIAPYQASPLPTAGLLSAPDVARAASVTPVEATLRSTLRGPVWVLKDADGSAHLRDAVTGRAMTPMTAAEARQLAGAMYQGEGRPAPARYHIEAPQEASRPGPLWSVDFDDAERTRFYLSPETGEVVSRRSNVWRLYDVFWRIHILDFRNGEDFNHPLLIAAAILTLPMVVTGLILVWMRFARDWRAARRRG